MSNTYFKMRKSVTTKGLDLQTEYTNKYQLTLTAFVGGENHTQLTLVTHNGNPNEYYAKVSLAHFVFNNEEVDLLIAGLLERKLGKISATGYEKSIFTPLEPD